MKQYKLITIAIFAVTILILYTYLSTKTIDKSQVYEDVITSISNDSSGLVLDNEMDIKKVKYLTSKKLDESEENLYLPVEVIIENQFITGNIYVDLNYSKTNDQWNLEDFKLVDKQLIFLEELNEGTLVELIKQNFQDKEIEELEIFKIELDNDELTQESEFEVVYHDDTVRSTQHIKMAVKYDGKEDGTLPLEMYEYEVVESEDYLINGITVSGIKAVIENLNIEGWAEAYEGSIIIENKNEIKDLSIIEQNTDLDNMMDYVIVDMKVIKENALIEGELELTFEYNSKSGWEMREVGAIREGKIILVDIFPYGKKEVLDQLIGQEFRYGYNEDWTILEDDIYDFSIEKTVFSEYGNSLTKVVSISLAGTEAKIEGELNVNYSYKDGSWSLLDVEPSDNFEVLTPETFKDELVEIVELDVVVSTIRTPDEEITYVAQNIADDDRKTTWCEGASDEGIGEWVEFQFENELEIYLIEMNLGYQKSNSIYRENLRPKKLLIEFSDGSDIEFDAEDVRDEQYIMLLEPIKTKSVKFTIEDVYGNDMKKDTCISEIGLYTSLE